MIEAEAIEVLKSNYPDPCYSLLREAVDMAIKALEQRGRKPMGKFIDVEATADKIYNKYGTHPVYYSDNRTEEGKEAQTDCIILEMIYDESRMVYADVEKGRI